jgi:hypothetical protein
VSRLSCLFASFLLFPLLAAADSPVDSALKYTPPEVPAAPDPAGLLFRLIGLTAGLLVLCGVVIWMAKRGNKLAGLKGDGGGRIRHEGSLNLDRRSAVHIIRVDEQTIAVTTDASGLRSVVVLSEPFERVLEEAEENAQPLGK